jgi:septum formation protein
MSGLEGRLKNFPFDIILASASPRRQELLKSLGFTYSCQPVNADESIPEGLKGQDIPLYLSKHKSKEFGRELSSNELLITADTIVWCEGQVLNKPADFEEGFQMLSMLSGKMHEVFTGVTIRSKDKEHSFVDCTRVYFKELSAEEITYYLNNYQPYDKAGAYGVQEWIGYIAIDRIEGSFYNVMGLPVQRLYEQLLKF